MLYLLQTRRHRYTVEGLLAKRARHLAGVIQPLFYEELPELRSLQSGSLIFTDLDRLGPAGLRAASALHDHLAGFPGVLRLYNDPASFLPRFELLRRLHEVGINDFTCARADATYRDLRLPVFLRSAHGHNKMLSLLWRDFDVLEGVIAQYLARGFSREDLYVVEFCDSSDADGLFTKYAAFRVDGQILPRHMDFGTHWFVKTASPLADKALRRQRRQEVDSFFADNPHAGWLERVYRIAGIDHGRADYAMAGGRPQLWEINTNPVFSRAAGTPPAPARPRSSEEPNKQRFYRPFLAALERLARPQDKSRSVSVQPMRSALVTLRASALKTRPVLPTLMDPEEALALAADYLRNGEHAKASAVCDKVLEMRPNFTAARRLRAAIDARTAAGSGSFS